MTPILVISRRLRSVRRRVGQKIYLAKRTQQYLAQEALTAVLYLTAIVVLHTYAMMLFEALSLRDSLWLTLVSITTVGYGDLSAQSNAGRLATIILIFLGGIFVLGKIAGDFIEFRASRRDAKKTGHWSYSRMKNHIVIIGSKIDSEQHLRRLIAECERNPETAGQEIVLITGSFGSELPYSLQKRHVKFVNGQGADPTFLKQAGVKNAEIIILLAWDENDHTSDGRAFDTVSRIREIGSTARIVVECVDNDNKARLENSGASLILRPIRAYPEMIIGSLLNPGSISILENLFTTSGESIFLTTVALKGLWADVVSNYVSGNKGIPIAYRASETGKIITAPLGTSTIDADALFILRSELGSF